MNEKLINAVSGSLRKIFEEYSSKGMLSTYIWGSVLTLDFNPETSDVDTIGIVDDTVDPSEESKIQKKLAAMHPGIKKLGFRLLYKSEFDTNTMKSMLGSLGLPKLMLLDLPTWHHVCGINFSQADFKLPVPKYKEAITLRYERFPKEGWTDFDSIRPEAIQYLVKQILRISHLKLLEKDDLPYLPFSYTSILNDSKGTSEEEIVNACLAIKSSHYDLGEFRKHRDILIENMSESVL